VIIVLFGRSACRGTHMLIALQIAMTISVVWFMAGLIGSILQQNDMRLNLGVGFTVVLTAAVVGYIWDVAHLFY
jgi:hypothetical protein